MLSVSLTEPLPNASLPFAKFIHILLFFDWFDSVHFVIFAVVVLQPHISKFFFLTNLVSKALELSFGNFFLFVLHRFALIVL